MKRALSCGRRSVRSPRSSRSRWIRCGDESSWQSSTSVHENAGTSVLASAARRPAHAHEIRRPQAGPVLLQPDQRLHQPRAVPVALAKVPRQASQHASQHVAGQIGTAAAGQEPAQARELVQMRAPPAAGPRPRSPRRPASRARSRPDSAAMRLRRWSSRRGDGWQSACSTRASGEVRRPSGCAAGALG